MASETADVNPPNPIADNDVDSKMMLVDLQVAWKNGKGCIKKKDLSDIEKSLSSCAKEIVVVYKVIGEDRFILVIRNDPDMVVNAIVDNFGSNVTIVNRCCYPCVHDYEFERSVLKLPEELLGKQCKTPTGAGDIYWMCREYDYRGMEKRNFMDIWRENSIAFKKQRIAGKIVADGYKVLGQKVMHIFMEVKDHVHHEIDALIDALPMSEKNGQNVKAAIKKVLMLHPSS